MCVCKRNENDTVQISDFYQNFNAAIQYLTIPLKLLWYNIIQFSGTYTLIHELDLFAGFAFKIICIYICATQISDKETFFFMDFSVTSQERLV